MRISLQWYRHSGVEPLWAQGRLSVDRQPLLAKNLDCIIPSSTEHSCITIEHNYYKNICWEVKELLLRCNSYSFASLLLWDKRDALIYSTWCCGHRGPSISKHNLFSNKISINKNKQIYLKSATKLCSITTAAPPARSLWP